MKLERILVPVDFSEHSAAALKYATALSARLQAALVLVHVWSPPLYLGPEVSLAIQGWSGNSLQGYAIEEATKEMNGFVERANLPAKVETLVEVGHPAETIVRVAKDGSVDLIVMGTHGRTGLGRLLVGSIAQQVVARAPCPVLTVKAPGELPR